MKGYLLAVWLRYALLAVASLVFLWCVIPGQAQTLIFVPCAGGGLAYLPPGTTAAVGLTIRCVDPKSFAPASTPPLIGGPCTPPAVGTIPYAQLPDGSCLPIIPVSAPGGIATIIQSTWSEVALVGNPVQTIVTLHTDTTFNEFRAVQ